MSRADRQGRAYVEDRLQMHARHQEAMAALSQLALSGLDLESLLSNTIERVAETLHVELVRVLELQPEAKVLVLRAFFGAEGMTVGSETISAGMDTQAGYTLTTGEPVVMTDVATEKRFSIPAKVRELGVVSGVTVAIPGQPHPYGVLAAQSTKRREFTSDEMYFVRSIANILGVAVAEARAMQALKGSESRMRAVVNNAVDAIITIDECGIIESVNPSAERLFGYDAAEMIGHNVSMLMPEPHRSMHDTYMENYLRTGKAKIIGIGREVVGQRKNDTTFPMELAVSEFRIGGRRMFAGSVRDISERRQLERQILEAAAEEQRRIGHDLHDGLCQQLTGIAFAAEVHLQKLRARSAAEAGTVEKIAKMIDDSITQARQLARGLQPVSLDATGLASALTELAKKVEEVFRVTCIFDCEQMVLVPDNVTATHLYRIAQEAVNNAIKHGKAQTLIIELAKEAGQIRLTIRDNGIGLDTSRGDGKGIGLQSMAYRARIIGGNFEIIPGSRGGAVVNCTVPSAVKGSGGNTSDSNRHVDEECEEQTAEEIEIGLGGTAQQAQRVNRSGSSKSQSRSRPQSARRQEARAGDGRSRNRR